MICIWSSWSHCHTSCLAAVKSRMVYLSGAGLPRLSREKRPLNRCSNVQVRHVLLQCGLESGLNSRPAVDSCQLSRWYQIQLLDDRGTRAWTLVWGRYTATKWLWINRAISTLRRPWIVWMWRQPTANPPCLNMMDWYPIQSTQSSAYTLKVTSGETLM